MTVAAIPLTRCQNWGRGGDRCEGKETDSDSGEEAARNSPRRSDDKG